MNEHIYVGKTIYLLGSDGLVSEMRVDFFKEIIVSRAIEQHNEYRTLRRIDIDKMNFKLNQIIWAHTPEEKIEPGFWHKVFYRIEGFVLSQAIFDLWKKDFPYLFKDGYKINKISEKEYLIKSIDKQYKIIIKNEI